VTFAGGWLGYVVVGVTTFVAVVFMVRALVRHARLKRLLRDGALMERDMLLFGNAFCEVTRNSKGEVESFRRVDPLTLMQFPLRSPEVQHGEPKWKS
jgi:hypothetical protein